LGAREGVPRRDLEEETIEGFERRYESIKK
jgi:hypothetical protein